MPVVRPFVGPIKPETHGKRHAYTVYGCRCERCTEANKNYARRPDRREKSRAYQRKYQADRRKRLQTNDQNG